MKSKKNIFLIFGQSASGKSTVEEKLCNLGYRKMTSHTSRTMRTGEVDGVNYYYVSSEKMEELYNNGDLVEFINYDGKMYGLHKQECVNNSIGVVEISGIEQFKKFPELDVLTIYLKTSKEVRMERFKNRGDNIYDIERRLSLDDIHFKNAEKYADVIIDASKPLDTVVQEVQKIIMSKIDSTI